MLPRYPTRLTSEEFSPGDVALGPWEGWVSIDDELRKWTYPLEFTRSNILVEIQMPEDIAKELALKIDNFLQNLPAWTPSDSLPKFIVTEEFKQAFTKPPR